MSFGKMRELLRTIFSEEPDIQEGYEELTEYVEKLSQMNIESLQSELTHLNEEKRVLKEQTQELAFSNYKTFVDTADTTRAIMTDFKESKDYVEDLIKDLPCFVEHCELFSAAIQNNMKKKSQISKIRLHSDKLMELVNLPTLMKAALSKGDYESALDLFTFVENLATRHGDVPVIKQISSEVNNLWFETLFQLYNQLRYDLPLPQCLQILSYLRRANTIYVMNSSDGTTAKDSLHLHFLKARSAWLKHSIDDAISSESQDRILRKVVELYRIHLFNVLTQHKAIFLTDMQDTNSGDSADEVSGNVALSSWLQQKVELFKKLLIQNLDNEDDSSFESIYNQCMYLSLSFGRIGADLRSVLTPLFCDQTKKVIFNNMDNVNRQFELQMRGYKVTNNFRSYQPKDDYNGPPEALLDFYPLAEYCNGLLTVLNSIRVTAPLSIVKDVYNLFRKSFDKNTEILLNYYHREQQTFSQIERCNFAAFCRCFLDDLLPYLSKCLAQVFPDVSIAEHLGITLSLLQESKLLHIDSEKYGQILGHILSQSSI